MNETQLQMKTLLCYDAYSEGFIRVGYKRHLGVGMSNLLALSLLSRLANGPCAYRNAFVMFYTLRCMSPDRPGECDNGAGRLRWQREAPGSLFFDHIPIRTAASCFCGHSLQESVSRFQYDQGSSGDVPSA